MPFVSFSLLTFSSADSSSAMLLHTGSPPSVPIQLLYDSIVRIKARTFARICDALDESLLGNGFAFFLVSWANFIQLSESERWNYAALKKSFHSTFDVRVKWDCLDDNIDESPRNGARPDEKNSIARTAQLCWVIGGRKESFSAKGENWIPCKASQYYVMQLAVRDLL